MSEETTALTERPDAPIEWGRREDVMALADRLKAMMPGKLNREEALLLAQYSAAMDANPFRGEIYAYQHRGKIILVEGYKLLVRWARRQCNFYERYERITNGDDVIAEDDIAFRCRLLRDDALPALTELTNAGVPNAYEIVSTEAVGVVTKADRTTREGKPQSPPTGWTWEDVARKRALKNAINRAYGSPSPREIAEESWRVEDQLTLPEDWKDVTPNMLPEEREALASAEARTRTRTPSGRSFEQDMADLGFGEPPEEPLEETLSETPPEPESAAEAEESAPEPPETAQESENHPKKKGITRPASPETVKGWLAKKAAQSRYTGPPTQNQLGLMVGLLNKILGGDKERRTWIAWTWGPTTSKDLTRNQVGATLDWLKPERAETGDYIPLPLAVIEAKSMLRQALLDAGQTEMF